MALLITPAYGGAMVNRPHDVTDLYLAPVLLAVDARIGELGKLDKDRLVYEVGWSPVFLGSGAALRP
jgi:hypothetical protein